ncbi:hypothetical protein BMS3Bbin11_00184 [bacterium BMS3Bbin11]|nr:hypothetical protein BMS3Bbin11_00184 [bacterium BMS3Bbin11]
MPTSQVATPHQTAAITRDMPRFSINQATAGSIRDIDDVQAAITIRTKNRAPNIWPPGICEKAIGSVWKISPGPAPGVNSGKLKTMGKMASPANNATAVSAIEIIIDVLAMDALSGRYEP